MIYNCDLSCYKHLRERMLREREISAIDKRKSEKYAKIGVVAFILMLAVILLLFMPWQKVLQGKKARNDITAIMWRMPVVILFRRNVQEQKVKAKRRSFFARLILRNST